MYHFGGDTDHGEVYACGGQGIYEKSLYLILDLTMKLKLLLKKQGLNEISELLWWLTGEESACQCRRHRFYSWSGKITLLCSN